MEDPVMEPAEATRRRPPEDAAGDGAAALLPPMMTGRHSTRFAGSAVVPSGPQSSPARVRASVGLLVCNQLAPTGWQLCVVSTATIVVRTSQEPQNGPKRGRR